MAKPVDAAIFRRGQKKELFGDGEALDERAELSDKLDELHSVWGAPRTGRDLSAAIWRANLGVAEVVLQKGKLFSHMGFVQGSKFYLHVEEAVYMVDRANLLLFVDEKGASGKRLLSLHEAYQLMMECGFGMDVFLVYCKLMRAGFIVQRHPATWILKPSDDPWKIWSQWHPDLRQLEEQQPGAAAAAAAAAPPSAPPAHASSQGRGCKRKLQREDVGWADWWAGGVQGGPWEPVSPEFWAELPRCEVLPSEHGQTSDYPAMVPLQRSQLEQAGGAAAEPRIKDLDVFSANSKFSRKNPGPPAFSVITVPPSQLPKLERMATGDGDARVSVRFATVEKGDIGFYGFEELQLQKLWV